MSAVLEQIREFETVAPVLEFEDILECVKVEPDEYCEAPWENDDGYDHEVVNDPSDGQAEGSFIGDRNSRHRGRKMVVLTRPDSWGNYGYWRKAGASKQVAFELQKAEEKRTLRQIARWHSDGWSVWQVFGRFEVDGKEYSDACGGIYDDDGKYARECRLDSAMNIASELEKAGYQVNGMPARKPYDKNAWIKERIRSKATVNQFNHP